MRPIEKTSEDLFQKLRSRFSPVSMGDESADETSAPTEARIFNFMYKDDEHDIGYVSISIIDNRSFKVYYGTDLVDRIENKANWYSFLKDLRMFAKRNLMSFDARDLAKNQLEPRDFKFISQQDGTYKGHEVTVSESAMFGSRRKSYQTMENVKMIVNHRKSIDETIPGARSRYIESIYLERADGERYKFPYNYLTGARAMARHVNEGGNPYDDMGKHIVNMIKEMRDLSKFARRTKKHAMEDENAGNIRNSVVERFHSMKKQLSAMSVKEGYARFVENFSADEALVEDDAVQQIKERFTQQVFDTQLEDTLPAVMKAIKEAEMKHVAEADKSIAHLIKSKPLVLRKDSAADQMFRSTKFTDGAGLLGFILSDIASRAIGDGADEIANFASDAAERVQDKDYDPKDKQTAMMLAKKYMDDVKKMTSNPSYADTVRVDPKNVYGKMKKREGGFHEAEQYEAWANDLVPEDNVSEISNKAKMDYVNKGMDWATNRTHSGENPDPDIKFGKRIDNIQKTVSSLPKKKIGDKKVGEATTQGTIGTSGTSGPAALAQNLKDPNLIKQSKLAAQALKTGGVQNVNAQTVAKTLGKQASSMPLNKKDMEPVAALGAKAMQAATNPKVANQLGALLKKAGI
jgi:predicted Rdx family selenoprotein